MSIEKPYQPSAEEMAKAEEMTDVIQNERGEEMMTDEQADASEEKEGFFQIEHDQVQENLHNRNEEEHPHKAERENFPVKQFKTTKGSIYAYDNEGKTTRFKTATGEQMDRQDITVFLDLAPHEEDAFLHDIDEAKVYVVEELSDGTPKIIRDISEINNKENIYLASIKDGRWIRKKRASVAPKEGHSVFDARQFKKDGQTYTERHLGNKVVEIKELRDSDAGNEGEKDVSVEHSRKLINAKNALKDVVENMRRNELEKMSDPVTFDFINGYGGDVNRYVFVKMKWYEEQRNADWGAFQIAEELDRIRERLEE